MDGPFSKRSAAGVRRIFCVGGFPVVFGVRPVRTELGNKSSCCGALRRVPMGAMERIRRWMNFLKRAGSWAFMSQTLPQGGGQMLGDPRVFLKSVNFLVLFWSSRAGRDPCRVLEEGIGFSCLSLHKREAGCLLSPAEVAFARLSAGARGVARKRVFREGGSCTSPAPAVPIF